MKRLNFLLTLLSLLLLQSCDFYDMGKKDFRLELPEPSENITTVQAAGYNYPYGMAGGMSFELDDGMEAKPIAWIRFDQGHSILTLTADGYQLGIYSNMLADDGRIPGDKAINSAFRHYDRTSVEDLQNLSLEAIGERWGDYTFVVPTGEVDLSGYVYPNIKLLGDGMYYEGVVLDATPDGVITDVSPLRGVHRNAFGHLPFYEKILSMNIMEWLMPGLWIDRDAETPSRGIFVSIIYSLLLYGIVVAAMWLMCALLYIPVELWLTPVRVLGGGIIFIGALCVEYIALISILDYYSAAWWVTAPVMLVWSLVPFQAFCLWARDFCPDCKSASWSAETKKIRKVEVPKMNFNIKWSGASPILVPAATADIDITYHTEKRCNKCGHIRESDYTSTVNRSRSICPRCFRDTVSGSFTKFDYDGRTLDAEYEEKCSYCGYRSIWTVNKVLQSRPSYPEAPARSGGGVRRVQSDYERQMAMECAYNVGNTRCSLGGTHPCKYFASGLPKTDCPYFKER